MLANSPLAPLFAKRAPGKDGSCCLLGEVPSRLRFSRWDGGRGKLDHRHAGLCANGCTQINRVRERTRLGWKSSNFTGFE